MSKFTSKFFSVVLACVVAALMSVAASPDGRMLAIDRHIHKMEFQPRDQYRRDGNECNVVTTI